MSVDWQLRSPLFTFSIWLNSEAEKNHLPQTANREREPTRQQKEPEGPLQPRGSEVPMSSPGGPPSAAPTSQGIPGGWGEGQMV